ncbi:MAG: hypothetical protein IKO10_16285 [Lachnospiraceae bacterium]|nr:hypothetical protein [Lachnospiraceae bacterium]
MRKIIFGLLITMLLSDAKVKPKFLYDKSEQVKQPSLRMTFVGDIRMADMRDVVHSWDNYICSPDAGYDWLISEPVQEEIAKMENTTDIWVFGLGAEDIQCADEYLEYVEIFAKKRHSGVVVVLSINPVDDTLAAANGYSVHNAQVDAFNKKIAWDTESGVYYLNTSWYLEYKGYETVDGVRYTKDTYRLLYKYIADELVW